MILLTWRSIHVQVLEVEKTPVQADSGRSGMGWLIFFSNLLGRSYLFKHISPSAKFCKTAMNLQ